MTPSLCRSTLAAALLVVLPSLAPAAASPPTSASPDLVLLAEPTSSDALAPGARGPVTLAYQVLEIFQGEPGSASVVVRHDTLTPDDRARLAQGERVILLAQRDPKAEGRWVAPAPLRATPSAVAAFRRWSAPEDVREARPVNDVLAEVAAGPPEPAASRPALAPATKAAPDVPAARAPEIAEPEVAEVAEPEPEVAEIAEPEPAETVTARRDVVAAPAAVAPPAPAVRPAPAPTPAPSVSPAISVSPRATATAPGPAGTGVEPGANPPLLYDAKLQPPLGPGLPPPPPATVLGPPLAERTDLLPPQRPHR